MILILISAPKLLQMKMSLPKTQFYFTALVHKRRNLVYWSLPALKKKSTVIPPQASKYFHISLGQNNFP